MWFDMWFDMCLTIWVVQPVLSLTNAITLHEINGGLAFAFPVSMGHHIHTLVANHYETRADVQRQCTTMLKIAL